MLHRQKNLQLIKEFQNSSCIHKFTSYGITKRHITSLHLRRWALGNDPPSLFFNKYPIIPFVMEKLFSK